MNEHLNDGTTWEEATIGLYERAMTAVEGLGKLAVEDREAFEGRIENELRTLMVEKLRISASLSRSILLSGKADVTTADRQEAILDLQAFNRVIAYYGGDAVEI